MPDTTQPDDAPTSLPMIVIDLGNRGRKKIKQLKEGEGPLMQEVEEAIEEVREQLGEEATDQGLLPVVLLYGKRPKKAKKCLARFFDL